MSKIEKIWISKEGFECWVVMTSMGHRCGYVRVSKDNLTNELNSYDDVPVSIHGGLTYGNNGVWGFDCAHLMDTPEIWTKEAVKEEVNKLSEQLSRITWKEVIKSKLEYMPEWFKIRVSIKGSKQ